MKSGSAAALAAALVLSGCATTAYLRTGGEPGRVDAQIVQASRRAAIGSPESLADAARILHAGGVLRDARAAGLQYIGATLYASLFPALDSPFPKGSGASEDAVFTAFPFFAAVMPAMLALDLPAPLDDASLSAFDTALAQADILITGSALPPYFRGVIMLRRSRPVEARALFEASLARAPGFYPAALKLSSLIIAGDSPPSELALLQQLAAALPTPVMRLDALARAFLAADKPDQAADAAAQGLLLAPDDPQFALLRARALDALGSWSPAVRIINALLARIPDNHEAILEKARILHEKGSNTAEALRLLNDAGSRFPSEPSFPELRGRILLETGRTDEGLAALTAALNIEPARHSTLTLLLLQAVRVGRWNEASTWLERIPESARSTDDLRLAWRLAMGLGDHAKAVDFARALEGRAGGAAAAALEARSLNASGQPTQARAVVDAALPQAGSALRSELHTIRALAGSPDPASDLRHALMENPDNTEALVSLSELLASRQDFRKAAEYARHAAELAPDDAGLARRARDLDALASTGK